MYKVLYTATQKYEFYFRVLKRLNFTRDPNVNRGVLNK